MGISIYKSIKQNSDGTFDVVSGTTNWRNARTGGVSFDTNKITWFKNEFPNASNSEIRALWLLQSCYVGDKFYPSSWKLGQDLAHKFLKGKVGDDYSFLTDKSLWLKLASEFLDFVKAEKTNLKNNGKKYVVKIGGGYFKRKRKYGCSITYNINDAKVFKSADVDDLKDKFSGFEKHGVEFVEI